MYFLLEGEMTNLNFSTKNLNYITQTVVSYE